MRCESMYVEEEGWQYLALRTPITFLRTKSKNGHAACIIQQEEKRIL
jgi:hypothetical protein